MKQRSISIILLFIVSTMLIGIFSSCEWGGENIHQNTDIPVTDEYGIPYVYPIFVNDIEQLTADEMKEINDAHYQFRYNNIFPTYHDEDAPDQKAALAEAHELVTMALEGENHNFFHNNADTVCVYRYLGKFDECAVLQIWTDSSPNRSYNIGEYETIASRTLFAYCFEHKKFVYFDEAIESGCFTEEYVELLNERIEAYIKYVKELERKIYEDGVRTIGG